MDAPPRMRSLFIIIMMTTCRLVSIVESMGFDGIPGDYCKNRRNPQCCDSRDDDCTAPILGNHLCYCDRFCNRRPDSDDCCPDFEYVCGNKPRPSPPSSTRCRDEQGNDYPQGTHKVNCNTCTCTAGGLRCDTAACMIQPDILAQVNQDGRYTWRGSNYTEFWGQTLEDGIRYRLGTLFPMRPVLHQIDILIEPSPDLPERFDAREKWPAYIHPVRNQGNCGASWAFSTTAVSSDRLAIQSEGKINVILSPQQIISCNQQRQNGCNGGHLDRAWYFLRKHGGVAEECYPYRSGRTNDSGSCQYDQVAYRQGVINCPSGSGENKYHKMTPPYKLTKEVEIRDEIFRNGPVQATFLVHEDFYIYRSGVYQHLDLARGKPEQYKKSAYHSVRILGWGVDYSTSGRPLKYWLCANSWGTAWGEEGLFKILRGENHCEIETFVLTAWGKGSKRRRRRFRVRKYKRRLRAKV